MAYFAVTDTLVYLVPRKASPQVSDALGKYTQGSYIKSCTVRKMKSEPHHLLVSFVFVTHKRFVRQEGLAVYIPGSFYGKFKAYY